MLYIQSRIENDFCQYIYTYVFYLFLYLLFPYIYICSIYIQSIFNSTFNNCNTMYNIHYTIFPHFISLNFPWIHRKILCDDCFVLGLVYQNDDCAQLYIIDRTQRAHTVHWLSLMMILLTDHYVNDAWIALRYRTNLTTTKLSYNG